MLKVTIIVLIGIVLVAAVGGAWGVKRFFASLHATHEPAPFAMDGTASGRKFPDRPVVALLASNKQTEITDLLAPYALFAASEAFEVVTVAPRREVSVVWPGLELVPDHSFESFQETYPEGARVLLIPAIADFDAPEMSSWLREEAGRGATVLSICEGARVAAAAGLLDRKRATTFFAAVEELENEYTETTWVRDVRWVQDGEVISSAGVTAGIDATFRAIEHVAGREASERAATALGVTPRPREMPSPVLSIADMAGMALEAGFAMPASKMAVLLHPGIDEFQLAAQLDAWQRSTRIEPFTVAGERSPIRSRFGMTLLPRFSLAEAPAAPAVVVLGPNATVAAGEDRLVEWAGNQGATIQPLKGAAGDAYDEVIGAIAARANDGLARFIANMLQYPASQLDSGWPLTTWLKPTIIGGLLAALLIAWRRRRQSVREAREHCRRIHVRRLSILSRSHARSRAVTR